MEIISPKINIFLQFILRMTRRHTSLFIKRFATVSWLFFAKTHPAKQISKSHGSFPQHISFRLLLVRARKFIIRDPPRVQVASERGGRHRPALPTHHRRMHARMHACMHRIRCIHPCAHAYLYVRPCGEVHYTSNWIPATTRKNIPASLRSRDPYVS